MGRVILIVCAIFVCYPSYAYAYIDPAAGSLFLQLLLGGIAGLLVILKLYWKKFTSIFSKEKQVNQDDR